MRSKMSFVEIHSLVSTREAVEESGVRQDTRSIPTRLSNCFHPHESRSCAQLWYVVNIYIELFVTVFICSKKRKKV